MRALSTIAACCLFLASTSVSGQSAGEHTTINLQATVDELLAVDRDFAKAAENTDMITGISAMFDEEVTAPLPSGKFAHSKAELVEAIRANPANLKARVRWSPVKAGLSADGQHGFTLGYVTIQDEGKSEPRLSKYLAYWIRRPEGWRVLAYKRETRPAGSVSLDMLQPSLPAKPVIASVNAAAIERYEAELKQTEAAFSSDARTVGARSAFTKFGSVESVNLGSSAEVTVGRPAMAAGPDIPMDVSWAADGARVAATGDLGFTWGTMRPGGLAAAGGQQTFPFFAVWRRADLKDDWRYIAR